MQPLPNPLQCSVLAFCLVHIQNCEFQGVDRLPCIEYHDNDVVGCHVMQMDIASLFSQVYIKPCGMMSGPTLSCFLVKTGMSSCILKLRLFNSF
jgi:hypothetical protein